MFQKRHQMPENPVWKVISKGFRDKNEDKQESLNLTTSERCVKQVLRSGRI
ncbi:hypothetical protein RhiirC2_805094 [Rhizophagus irregularis]|uniref:Uncharacterized protein n=1 Tax=Rhizophagus irregularis TaxID=588596 RepID=A0A2N1KV60_9GLOM|nr:hypothetical protein RhiirC2_805094 [Rhizophagus irregularis]